MNNVALADVNLFYYMTTANLYLLFLIICRPSPWPEPVYQQVIFTKIQWLLIDIELSIIDYD